MDLLFGGTPAFALELLRAGHRLRAVALPYLDEEPELWELLQHAHAAHVPLFPAAWLTEDAGETERAAVRAAGPYDLVLTMCFDRRVAAWARELGTRGAWNLHPSQLPRHRGYNPYYWTVRAGDATAGVTLHHMTERFDAGDVLLQQAVDVPAQCTSGMLCQVLNEVSVPLVLRALQALQSGRPLPRTPQLDAQATRAPQPSDEELTVDLEAPVEEVVRKIRAATPEPGALLFLAERMLVVKGAREGPPPPAGAQPGEAFLAGGVVYLVAGGGSLRPLRVEAAADAVDLGALLGLR